MLLENECLALGRWFDETWPQHELIIHQGHNSKTGQKRAISTAVLGLN